MFEIEKPRKDLTKPWMRECRFVRVTDQTLDSTIDRILETGRGAIDLETTGLDCRLVGGSTIDKVVGICLSASPSEGYYIPLRHQKGQNCTPSLVVRALRRLFGQKNQRFCFHNAKFDQEFLDGDSVTQTLVDVYDWMDLNRWDDTMLGFYVADPRAKLYGLKRLSNILNDGSEMEKYRVAMIRRVVPQNLWPYMQREMIELGELFEEEFGAQYNGPKNFSMLDPDDPNVIAYGCSDAVCTHGLQLCADHLIDKSLAFTYSVEKGCSLSVRWMERTQINVDRERVRELMIGGQREAFEALQDIYQSATPLLNRDIRPLWFRILESCVQLDPNPDGSINYLTTQIEECRLRADKLTSKRVGDMDKERWLILAGMTAEDVLASETPVMGPKGEQYPAIYDVSSAPQLGRLFEELGVQGLGYTEKSKQVDTSREALDALLEEQGDQYPFLGKIKLFRNVQKALSTYLEPIWKDSEQFGSIKIQFKQTGTDTGRFSTPAGSPGSGATAMNLQALPAAGKKGVPQCLSRIREVIRSRPGFFIVGIDFSGVELRIVTNLSGEPKWTSEFFRCDGCGKRFDQGDGVSTPEPPPKFCPECGSDKIGDLHTLTAIAIYGEDKKVTKEWKTLRGKAKCVDPQTLVFCEDTGLGPIQSLIGPQPVGHFRRVAGWKRVWGPEGSWRAVIESYQGGNKPLRAVVTTDGVLVCSEEHQFVLGDRSLTKTPQVGEILYRTPHPTAKEDRIADQQIPYDLVGGTAHLPTPSILRLAGLCGAIFGSATDLTVLPNGIELSEIDPTVTKALGVCGLDYTVKQGKLVISGLGILNLLNRMGVLRGSSRSDGVPLWVLRGGIRTVREFTISVLSGGGFATREPRQASGIAAIAHYAGVSVVCGYHNGIYTVEQGAPELHKVVAVVPIGEGQCVDLSLGDDHLYWTAGILTHNSTNFALCYGGGGAAVVRAAGCSKDEGWEIKHKFDQTYRGLASWWKQQQQFAREHKYVLTAFGRRYPLHEIDSTDGFIRSKMERNSINGPVQGCLHRDTRIPTNHGILRIEDLADGSDRDLYPDLKVWDGIDWVPARVLRTEPKRVVAIHFASGVVMRTSPAHQFRVRRGKDKVWVRAEDLSPEDWIMTSMMPVEITGKGADIPLGVMYLLGKAYRTGTLTRNLIRLHVGDNEVDRKGASKIPDTKIVGEYVEIHNRKFLEHLTAEMGLTDQHELPNGLWFETLENRRAFLSGYSDLGTAVPTKISNAEARKIMILARLSEAAVTTIAPPDLIAEAGEAVMLSSLFPRLTSAQLEVVLRMCDGTAKLDEMVWAMSEMEDHEIPDSLEDLYCYGYDKAITVEDTGMVEGMFDIEVASESHTFVADGPLTHNTSADITKIAMWLIYREVHRRGWQDKVRMLVTMHDELVFEIHETLLHEAIEVINELMTRNKPLLNRKWPIPLTSDVEIGYTWAVPWNLEEIKHTGEWPDELKPWFPEEMVNRPGFRKGEAAPPQAATPQAATPKPTVVSPQPEPKVAAPTVEEPAHYHFRLRAALTQETAERLAKVILESQSPDGDVLTVYTPEGKPIPFPQTFRIVRLNLEVRAKSEGLL